MVVVATPDHDNLLGITHISEPVLAQTGIAKASVEILYKGVMTELGTLDKMQLQANLLLQD